MPPYNSEAPSELPESTNSSPVPSIIESLISESPLPSDNDISSSDSDYVPDTYVISAPGYEKIRIPLEQNLRQLLIKVTETNDLDNVTKIKLRVIARDFSLQRLPAYMPHLTELNLDGSALMSLRDLGCDMGNLTILHVTRCGLNSLDGLFGMQGLIELHAASNNIDDLSPCAALPKIQKLDLRNNRIQDVTSVSFLSLCETLRHLSLEGCPTAEIKNYRMIIKDTLPTLLSLDDIEFADEDRSIGGEEDEDQAGPSTLPLSSRLPRIHSATFKDLTLKLEKPNRRPFSTGEMYQKTNLVPLSTRPATARRATKDDFSGVLDGSELKLRDVYSLFVPSLLTSGKPLCGNPAIGLKQRIQAWGKSPKHKNKSFLK